MCEWSCCIIVSIQFRACTRACECVCARAQRRLLRSREKEGDNCVELLGLCVCILDSSSLVLSFGRRFVLHTEGRQLHPDLRTKCRLPDAMIMVPDLFVHFMTSPRKDRSPEAFCLVQSAPWYRAVTSGYLSKRCRLPDVTGCNWLFFLFFLVMMTPSRHMCMFS